MSCVSPTETAAPSARYAIINLIEKAGHTLGLSRPMIDHLAYLIRHTQEVDWQPGNRAIVYKSVTLMARDQGIGERQINNRERELIDTLNLEHAPSGNFRRYGYRDKETGRILRAFGIDITALKSRLPALETALAEQEAAEARWRDRKHELSGLKGRIRKLMDAATAQGLGSTAEALQARYAGYLGRIRAETTTQEIERRILCARALKDALERALLLGKTAEQPVKTSDTSEPDFRHKDSSIDLHTTDESVEAARPVDIHTQPQSTPLFPLRAHIPETYRIESSQTNAYANTPRATDGIQRPRAGALPPQWLKCAPSSNIILSHPTIIRHTML
ncbi:MAG: helix-turn-helix domain-containing protein [Rhodospirillaceae bacterium]